MALSRRVALGAPGLAAGVGVLTALAVISVVPGSASADTVAGGCQATAHVQSHWGSGPTGGEIVDVTVANTAATAATTWSVTWVLGDGQRIVSAWNAMVSTSGHTSTAVNAAWNGKLAPGATTSFGMQLAGTDSAPVLNCSNDATPTTSSPPSSPPVSVSASASTQPGGDVRLTEADSQTSVSLVVGQTLGVSLPAAYRPFTSSSPALVLRSTSGGYNTGQPLSELFKAVETGSVDLNTQTDDPCFHTTPACARPVRGWTVHITIVPASPGGVTLTEADNKTTVNVAVQRTITVSLPANYRPFTAPSPAVLLQSTSGGFPSGQPLREVFLAVAGGSFDLATQTDLACSHDPTPCPAPYRPWTVHVFTVYPPPVN
jgi:Cellulose binding domain